VRRNTNEDPPFSGATFEQQKDKENSGGAERCRLASATSEASPAVNRISRSLLMNAPPPGGVEPNNAATRCRMTPVVDARYSRRWNRNQEER